MRKRELREENARLLGQNAAMRAQLIEVLSLPVHNYGVHLPRDLVLRIAHTLARKR